MRKSLLIVPVILVVAVAVWGPRLAGDNSKRKISVVPDNTKSIATSSKEEISDIPTSPVAAAENNNLVVSKEEIPVVDPVRKEIIVEGTVEQVDYTSRVITIAQELDDNSKKIDPRVTVNKDALIKNGEGKVSMEAIKTGDYVIMVIDANGQARAVEINY